MAVTNAQYCAFFWVDDQANPGKMLCTMCNCSRTKPEKSQGYSNMMNHLTAQHRNYDAIYVMYVCMYVHMYIHTYCSSSLCTIRMYKYI